MSSVRRKYSLHDSDLPLQREPLAIPLRYRSNGVEHRRDSLFVEYRNHPMCQRVVRNLRDLQKLVLVDRSRAVLVKLHEPFLQPQQLWPGDWEIQLYRPGWTTSRPVPAAPEAPYTSRDSQFEFFSSELNTCDSACPILIVCERSGDSQKQVGRTRQEATGGGPVNDATWRIVAAVVCPIVAREARSAGLVPLFIRGGERWALALDCRRSE